MMVGMQVGWYSPVTGVIPMSAVECIDPKYDGVGDQEWKQVRTTISGLEHDTSYEDFAKEYAPVYAIAQQTADTIEMLVAPEEPMMPYVEVQRLPGRDRMGHDRGEREAMTMVGNQLARLSLYDEDDERVTYSFESPQVPRVGDIVCPPGATTVWRVVAVQWTAWPSPGSVAHTSGDRGPMVDLRCERAAGIHA